MDEQYIRYLLSIGINPYDPYTMNMMGGVMPILDEGYPDANTNTIQDTFQIQSDPAFLAGLGDSPGGYRPQDFAPQVQEIPVQATGYSTLNRYLGSSDPVSRIIATIIKNGGTANSAEREIRDAFTDPNHPYHAEVAPYVMTSTNDMGEEEPDWQLVRTIATDLEKAVINDPVFDDVDANGNPIVRREEESEASRYFREAGLPMPDERYDWRTLADNPEEIASTMAGIPIAENDAAVYKGDRDRLRQEMMAMVATRDAKPLTPGDQQPSMWGRQKALGGGDTLQQARSGRTDGERVNGLADAVRRGAQAAGGMATDPMRADLNSDIQAKKKQIMDSARMMLEYQRDAQDRKYGVRQHGGKAPGLGHYILTRELAEQGRTPLNDTLLARRQAMMRYGIQA